MTIKTIEAALCEAVGVLRIADNFIPFKSEQKKVFYIDILL